jgi:hypothetical protein
VVYDGALSYLVVGVATRYHASIAVAATAIPWRPPLGSRHVP